MTNIDFFIASYIVNWHCRCGGS